MIVHNLTDQSPPYRPKRRARDLKIAGVLIQPGKSGNIPDHRLNVSDISGWVTSMEVSVDGLPEWYQAGRRKKQDAAVPKPKLEVVPDAPKEPEVKVEVGAMEATVKAEPDGELGTEDDQVSIKPKKKSKGKKK